MSGIYSKSDLTLSGKGSLSVTGDTSPKGGFAYGIYTEKTIEINSINVTATSYAPYGENSYALYSDIDIIINSGVVDVQSISDSSVPCSSFAIHALRNVNILGGKVTATGTVAKGDVYGIYASNVEISGGTVNAGTVEINGVTYTSDYGIYAATVEISGGTVNAAGISSGIYACSTYNGEEPVEGTGEVTISGGNVRASGNTSGICGVKISVSQLDKKNKTVIYAEHTDSNVDFKKGAIVALPLFDENKSLLTETGLLEVIGGELKVKGALFGINVINANISQISKDIETSITAESNICAIFAQADYDNAEVAPETGVIDISGGTVETNVTITTDSDVGLGIAAIGAVKVSGGKLSSDIIGKDNIKSNSLKAAVNIISLGAVTIDGGDIDLNVNLQSSESYAYLGCGIFTFASDVKVTAGEVSIVNDINGDNAVGLSGGIYTYLGDVDISGDAQVYSQAGNAAVATHDGKINLENLQTGKVEAIATEDRMQNASGAMAICSIEEDKFKIQETESIGARLKLPKKGYAFYENNELPSKLTCEYNVDAFDMGNSITIGDYDVYTATKNYVKIEPGIQIKYQAQEGGYVTPEKEVLGPMSNIASGSTATAETGYVFVGWYDADDMQLSTEAKFVPTKNEQGVYEEATYTAKFAKEDVTSDEENFTDLNDSDDEENENIQDVATSDSTQTGQNMTTLYLSLALAVVAIIASVLLFKKKRA